jgi:hypothetical protein
MIGTQVYQQVKPCIDQQGHKFAANLVRVVVCERCGITRQEATGR